MRRSLYVQIITAAAFVFLPARQLAAQVDLSASTSFFGYWEGKVTFKAFSVDQPMNIEILKGASDNTIGLIVQHTRGTSIQSDTQQCLFENGVIKIPFNAKSVTNENEFCSGFLMLNLQEAGKLTGRFESEKNGCTAIEYFAIKKANQPSMQGNEASQPHEMITAATEVKTPDEEDELAKENAFIELCGNGKIVRKKDMLEIKLGNENVIRLKDVLQEGEEFEHYKFEGCIAEMNLYKFYVAGWEWSSYLLINRQNGMKYKLISEPVLSPDKTKIATYLFADGYSSDENYIIIYSFQNGQLVQQFKLNPKAWGPTDLTWKNNMTIVIETGKHDDMADETKKLKSRTLSLVNKKWTVK